MAEYRRRVLDDTLDGLQPHLRALSLHGPKGVGKTATAMQRAVSVVDLSLPAQREILSADPSVLTRLPGPVLVDEWQRLPEVWDQVRHAVDAGSPPGHFIVAGSSAPRGQWFTPVRFAGRLTAQYSATLATCAHGETTTRRDRGAIGRGGIRLRLRFGDRRYAHCAGPGRQPPRFAVARWATQAAVATMVARPIR